MAADVRRRMLYVVVAVLSVSLTVSSILYSLEPSQPARRQVMVGSLFASDAGQSHGGFEYTASWNATLTSNDGNDGLLTLVLDAGLGDALDKHDFAVTGFSRNATDVAMVLDGLPLVLKWTSHDGVWNGTYDNYYIASWGSDAPTSEIIGQISPGTFTGLHQSWYVELRLR